MCLKPWLWAPPTEEPQCQNNTLGAMVPSWWSLSIFLVIKTNTRTNPIADKNFWRLRRALSRPLSALTSTFPPALYLSLSLSRSLSPIRFCIHINIHMIYCESVCLISCSFFSRTTISKAWHEARCCKEGKTVSLLKLPVRSSNRRNVTWRTAHK